MQNYAENENCAKLCGEQEIVRYKCCLCPWRKVVCNGRHSATEDSAGIRCFCRKHLCGLGLGSGLGLGLGIGLGSRGVRWRLFLAEGPRIRAEPGGAHANPSGFRRFRSGRSSAEVLAGSWVSFTKIVSWGGDPSSSHK